MRCFYDLKHEVKSNERQDLMDEELIISADEEPPNPECNRTPSFNKIAFIFNDKVQCINIGLNSMCAKVIHAFIRGLSLRKREARSRLPCLLVSFWVAPSENGSIFRRSC